MYKVFLFGDKNNMKGLEQNKSFLPYERIQLIAWTRNRDVLW
jgi:hypothetical protein